MSISKTKRFLVFVLAMAMTVTMCPVNMAFAASDDADNGRQVIEIDNKAANEEADFTTNSSDISKENLAFEVSYIAEHYNEAYIDGVVEDAQFAPVSLARGVATYTRKTYGENFENGDIPSNIISSQEYTIPIYDVDPDSDYYVMIANVNLADKDAKPYDTAVIWNNNLGNNLEDVFYDESTSILYVNKYYIDNPDMSQVDTEGEPIAVQTLYQWDENYYADGTADYGKDLPVIVSNASGSEVEERTVAVNNMFDLTTIIPSVVENPSRYTIDDFDICMNGSFAPLDDSAYHYDNETGEITLDASASTISSLMIYVNDGSILNSLTSAFSVKAGVPSNMAFLKYKNETVKFSSEMREKWFLGWRGHYGPNQTKNKWTVAHGTGHTKLKGETESLKYLYRPNTKSAYWAISSYTRGKNFNVSNDTGVTATKKYYGYNKKKGTKKTLYDWMRSYLDNIDKFNGKYWSAHPSFKQTKYNGSFQGCNCFTFRMPNHFVGADNSGTDPGNLVSEGPNKGADCKSLDVKMADGQKFKPVSNGFYGCCRHLKLKYDSNDTMGGGNKKARIDVAVLALTDDYVVLSFCNNKTIGKPGDTQEGMAIYKFAFDDTVDPQFSTTLKDYGVSDPGVKWDDREPGNVKIQDEILYKDLDKDSYKVNAVMKVSDSVNLDPNKEEENEGENGGEDETEEEAINVTGEDPDTDDGNDGGVSSADGVVTIDGNNVYINADQDAYSSYTGGMFFVVVTDSTGAQVAVEEVTNNELTISGLTTDHTITVYYGTSSTDMSRPVVSTPYVESAGIDDGPGAPADDEDTEELAEGTVIAKTNGKVSPNAAFKVNTGKSQKDWQRGSFVTLGMNGAGTKYVDVYKSGLYNGVGLFNTEYKAGVQARIYLGDKSKFTLNADLKKAAEATKITCPFGTLTFDKEALYNYPEGTTKSVVETGAKFNVYNSKYKSYEEAVAANKDYEHYEYDQIVIADHLINRMTPDGKVVLSDYLDWQHHNGMLVPGTYVVEEVSAGNFAKSHQLIDSFTVNVEKRKITDAGEKDNTPYEYELTVEKRSTNPWREGWEPYTEDPLYSELTQFRIESIDDPTNAFVADGQPPAASNAQHAYLSQPGFTVDKNTSPWTIKINNLKAGHYRITEDAPIGYWMPKDKAAIEFEVYRDMDKNLKVDVDSIVEHEGKWTEIDTRTKETKDRQETKVTFTRSNVPQGTAPLKLHKDVEKENAFGIKAGDPFPYVEFNLYADPDNPQTTDVKDDGGDIVAYDGHADHVYYKAGQLIRGIQIDEETGERHYFNDGKEVSEETYRIMTDLDGNWTSEMVWNPADSNLKGEGTVTDLDKAWIHYPLNNNNLIDTYDKDGKKTGNKDGISYYKFQEAYIWMFGDHISFTDAEKEALATAWVEESAVAGYGTMDQKIESIGLSMQQILNHGIDITESHDSTTGITGSKTYTYSSFGKQLDADTATFQWLTEKVLQWTDPANGVDDTKETIMNNRQRPVGEIEYNLLVLWPDQLTQFPKIPETYSEFQVLPDNVDETHWIDTVEQAFTNEEPPLLKTLAQVNDKPGNKEYNVDDEKVTIHDTISYYNLKVGRKYDISGTLYKIKKTIDEENNETWVLGDPILDENGDVYTVHETVVPTNSKDKVEMLFDVTPKQLGYKDVVVIEKCELEDNLIAIEPNMDPNVESQQVHPNARDPRIETVATYNGKHIMPNDTDVTFTDTVSYINLTPGTKYTLRATLMEKDGSDTGVPVQVDGKDVVVEHPFTASDEDGSVDVPFSVNTSDLDGKTVVVFEELLDENGNKLKDTVTGEEMTVEHKDINDENQTMIIPSVETTATDTETKAHVGEVNTTEKIVDVVKYTNLIPGEKYRVDGKLMRKEKANAEPVAEVETTPADQTPAENNETTPADQTPAENNEVTQDATQEATPVDAATEEAPVVLAEASEEFTAEKADGEVKLTFTVDSTKLKGYSSVAFEELVDVETNAVIGIHKDIEDEDQTIHYPEVTTDAVDGKTGLHTGELGSEVTIVDTVTYKNLVPGLEYTLTGTLMDKSTGDPLKVDGKAVKSTATFTPETADGTYDLEFKLDSTALAGTSAVAFEELEYNNVLVAEHKDIEDEDQTVDYPEIGTVAVDGQTQAHEGLADGDVTIVDTVNYKNLTPGVTYIVRGTLMDKETGEPFTGVVATSDTDKASNIAETVVNAASDATNSTQDKADATKPATETPAAETLAADTPAADGQTDGQATEPKADETQTPAADAQADTNKQDEAAKADENKTDENANKPAEDKAKDTGATAPVEVQFVAPAKDGSVQVTFNVKNADLAGKKLVAFESMYVVGKDGKEVEVARHEDLNDADQTVSYPEIKTNAVDADSEEHVGLVRDKITIKDKVTYKNLTPGQTYTVVGTLMDKETGKAIVAGSDATKSTKKTTTTGSDGTTTAISGQTGLSPVGTATDFRGTVNVYNWGPLDSALKGADYSSYDLFMVDAAKALDEAVGKTYMGVLSGKFSGADDSLTIQMASGEQLPQFIDYIEPGQTGSFYALEYVPLCLDGGKTSAFGLVTINVKNEGTEKAQLGDCTITSIDRHLEDATKTVEGDKKSETQETTPAEKAAEGAQASGTVTAQKTFTAENADGSVELEFTFTGVDMSNKAAVAFEKLYVGKEIETNKTVATHEDINDADQTVFYPTISTKASYKDGVITDTVTYKNLIPGLEYEVSGTLMDKKSGNSLEISAMSKFTPKEANGSIDMKFEVDKKALAGKTVVVFETLKLNGKVVAEHKDINDKDQTVTIGKETTPSKDKSKDKSKSEDSDRSSYKTGDFLPYILIAILLMILASIAVVERRRRRE